MSVCRNHTQTLSSYPSVFPISPAGFPPQPLNFPAHCLKLQLSSPHSTISSVSCLIPTAILLVPNLPLGIEPTNHRIKTSGSMSIGGAPSSTGPSPAPPPTSKYYQQHSQGTRSQAPGGPVGQSRGAQPGIVWSPLEEGGQ